MQSQWNDDAAKQTVEAYGAEGVNEDIALRVYTTRLIGRDHLLVLHGGGNTSVKTRATDDLGKVHEVIAVKGSGADMADMEPWGLPAVKLGPLRELRALDELSDESMVNAQRLNLLDASAPNPSVETLLHAFLPHKFIDHTHAAAVLSLVDQPDGEALAREVYDGRMGIVPYIAPGFGLAKAAAQVFEEKPDVEGLILHKHGIFTFAETAREAYERMIEKHHEVLRTDPSLWTALHRKAGWLYYHGGNKTKARVFMRRALGRNPLHAKTIGTILLHEALGNNAAGIHRWLSAARRRSSSLKTRRRKVSS